MKIGIISAFWGPAYPTGSGIYAYEIARRLAQDHEVHVFTSKLGNLKEVQPEKFKLHVLRTYGLVWNMNPLVNVFTKLLRCSFDIIHVNSYIFFASNAAAFSRLLKKFKYVLHFHGGLNYCGAPQRARLWIKENIYDRTVGLATVKFADAVLSVSKSDIPIIKKKFKVNASWCPIGVCTNKFKFNKPSSRTVVYVGKLEKWKGAHLLLDIFEKVYDACSDVDFLVVGKGSLTKKLANSKLPLKIVGHVNHNLMPQIYSKAAITILPSFMEGLPTVCLESLASGVPVVASEVGDTPEIVLDGKTGFIVRPGDVKSFAEKIRILLEDKKLRFKMARAGREYIEKNFSYDRLVKNLYNFYQRLLLK